MSARDILVTIAAMFLAAAGAGGYLAVAIRAPHLAPLPGPVARLLERIPAPPTLRVILDGLTVPLRYARRGGGHRGAPLTVKFRVGGELADGTFIHTGDTGPMPAVDWDTATPFPQAGRPATEAGR